MSGATKTLSTLTASEIPRTHIFVPRLRIEVVQGPDAGSSFFTQGDITLVGTHPSVDMILSDPTVSRFHCELSISEFGVRVRDQESHNGTFIGDVEVSDGFARIGSTLKIGDTQIKVLSADKPVALPLASAEHYGAMYGKSSAMRSLFVTLARAAGSDATVILEGETGTGKELAAEALHSASDRRDGPFVVVDCGSLPKNLIKSELFGHVRGAFSGCTSDRVGAFEAAKGGTIFLDEIGELDTSLQPTLLRVLESRKTRRVGSDRDIPTDVRVVAATNRNLRAEVNNGQFRSDLYYRLAVLTLRIPPLRKRSEDIPGLIRGILSELGEDPKDAEGLFDIKALAHGRWPGNVRELRNHVEEALVFGRAVTPGSDSELHSIDGEVDISKPYRVGRKLWIDRFESLYFAELLRAHRNNVTSAARSAGIDRVHLHRLLKRVGLR